MKFEITKDYKAKEVNLIPARQSEKEIYLGTIN